MTALLSPLAAFGVSIVVAAAAKTAAWLIQRRTGNAGLVDAVWAWTLGSLAILYAVFGDAPPALRVLLALMGGAWGLRLGTYLWRRNFGRPEDFRYAQLRARWGARAQSRLFWFFQFQNVFTLALAASAFMPVAWRDTRPADAAIAVAIGLWLVALAGEAIADAQMAAFRANPANRGRVCRDGLWRYSRHPNYFFECVHWTAYLPLALGAPYGWAALAAPIVVAVLLLRFSGVPLLESEMVRRNPAYADYIRTTSQLVPWPPKHEHHRIV